MGVEAGGSRWGGVLISRVELELELELELQLELELFRSWISTSNQSPCIILASCNSEVVSNSSRVVSVPPDLPSYMSVGSSTSVGCTDVWLMHNSHTASAPAYSVIPIWIFLDLLDLLDLS